MVVKRYRVGQKITAGEEEELFLDFFQNDNVLQDLNVRHIILYMIVIALLMSELWIPSWKIKTLNILIT